MERYRARRDGENRENRTRKGNPPRSSRGLACTLPRGRGRGDTPFISLSPPPISRDVFVNWLPFCQVLHFNPYCAPMHIANQEAGGGGGDTRVKKLATPILLFRDFTFPFSRNRDPIETSSTRIFAKIFLSFIDKEIPDGIGICHHECNIGYYISKKDRRKIRIIYNKYIISYIDWIIIFNNC